MPQPDQPGLRVWTKRHRIGTKTSHSRADSRGTLTAGGGRSLLPTQGGAIGRPAPDRRSVGARAAHLVGGRAGVVVNLAALRVEVLVVGRRSTGSGCASGPRAPLGATGRPPRRLRLVQLAAKLVGGVAGGRDVDDRLRPPRAPAKPEPGEAGKREEPEQTPSHSGPMLQCRVFSPRPAAACPGAVAPEGGAASDQGKEYHG